MQQTIADLLQSLNRGFYRQFAEDFSATRGPEQPGLHMLVSRLGLETGHGVLDLGCGNGRLALVLESLALPLRYVGVDASPELLGAARNATVGLAWVAVDFALGDLSRPDWQAALPAGQFDVIALLAVLHHVPGRASRRALLASLQSLLAPDGMLAVSTWQFLNSDRLRRKIVDWSAVGLTPEQVEPGDFLLDWQRGGSGLRYCHMIDREELQSLALESGWRLVDSFGADGRQGDLNLFGLLRVAG